MGGSFLTWKYVKGDDSRFGLLEVPALYVYPGEGDRRVLTAVIADLGGAYGEMAELNASLLKKLGPSFPC